MVDSGFTDILDAALDELLQSDDPFLLELPNQAATLATASSAEPKKPANTDGKGAEMTPAQKKREAKEKRRTVIREAQRRFRARQKNVISELEDRIESTKLVLEQEQEENTILTHKNDVMENLLVFKDSQVVAIQDTARQNGPSRTVESRVFPEILLLLKNYALPAVFNLEKLLRFAPAGYTDHLDDDIFAIQAPPLSAHIEQCRLLVARLQFLLAEATSGINTASTSSSAVDSTSVSDLSNMLKYVHLGEAIKKGVAAVPSPTQPTEVDVIVPQGVSLEYCGVKYSITKDLMQRIIDTLLALGQHTWSMAIFFPDTLMEFATTNMETGQSAATSQDFNDVNRWLNVLRMLGLRQEQLETCAREQYQYLSTVRPVLRERATIMQHLMQAASRQADSIKDHIEATADLGDCTSALAEIVRKEYVAWVDFMATLAVRGLDYPVQRMLIWTLSWPYMPNINLLGAAAALELGLNPFEYQFNESDFEKAPFLRPQE